MRTISTLPEVLVLVMRKAPGIYLLEPGRADCANTITFIVRCILKVILNLTFYIMVTNLPNLSVNVPKYIKLVELTQCPSLVVTMMDDPAEQEKPVTAIHIYRKKIGKDKLIRKHRAVTTKDPEKTEEDWRDQINFNSRHHGYRLAFEMMMSKYPLI